MNRKSHPNAFSDFDDIFSNNIDKILVGKESYWEYDSLIYVPDDAYHRVYNTGRYSDHPVPVLELEAVYPAD